MYKIASKLEGFPRHTSSHAAGIVMCQKDLDEVIPLTTGDGMYLTGYTMEYLEELGLLKMDFLVLKNLTLIDNIINDIKEIANTYHEEFVNTFNAMNFSYDLYSKTETEYHSKKVQEIFKKLYDQGVITEQQYDEVCKIIYEKINRCSKEFKSC